MTDAHASLLQALSERYAIERERGAGGMATVYRAATLGRDRFLREVQPVAKLVPPHILPLHDSGEANGALHHVGVVHRDITPDNSMLQDGHAVAMSPGARYAID